MKYFFGSLVLVITIQLKGASVDTVLINSQKMKKSFKCVVIKPGSYEKSKQTYPVVYLLHGYGDGMPIGSYGNRG